MTLPCQDLGQHHKYHFPRINCLVPVLQQPLVSRQVHIWNADEDNEILPIPMLMRMNERQNVEDEKSCQRLLSQVDSALHSTNAESTDSEASR